MGRGKGKEVRGDEERRWGEWRGDRDRGGEMGTGEERGDGDRGWRLGERRGERR